METQNFREPVSYGDVVLPPVVLSPEVEALCEKLDEFFKDYPRRHRKQKASDLIEGAFYAARPECRSNPDWMSQSANSLRDLLYPLSGRISENNLIKVFDKYAKDQSGATNKDFINTFRTLDKLYGKLTDLTHHGSSLKNFSDDQFIDFSEQDFECLMENFVSLLGKAFSLQQIYIHAIIKLIVQNKCQSAVKRDLQVILKVNHDARLYFYTKVDESWLTWLWENGFLDVLKKNANDLIEYGYRTPEIAYFGRMAEKAPAKVADIIISVNVSKDNFNPVVIEQFLHICSVLPALYLARLVEKIREEQWIPLMSASRHRGFEYAEMFKILADAKDDESLIALSTAVLAICSKEEMARLPRHGPYGNPFYFDDLSRTGVFPHLVNVGSDYIERALDLAIAAFIEIIELYNGDDKSSNKSVFELYDKLLFADVDFFNLETGKKNSFSLIDNLNELAAVMKTLLQRVFDSQRNNPDEIRRIYSQYIKSLPDSQATWRLRLYTLSLNPEIFREELKRAYFRVFEVKQYYPIIAGAEYEKTLQKGFFVLSEEDKSDYIKKVIEYFRVNEEKNDESKWRISAGSGILSMILPYLETKPLLKKQVETAGFKPSHDYHPLPAVMSQSQSGIVVPRGPISQAELSKLPVKCIIKKLRSEWAPENLRKIDSINDFLNPLNAEGVGILLRSDIAMRLQDYTENAGLFFEQTAIHPHYLYSLFRGVQEAIQHDRQKVSQIDWQHTINLMLALVIDLDEEKYSKNVSNCDLTFNCLVDLNAVYSSIVGVIIELLNEKQGVTTHSFAVYREKLFIIIERLLEHSDPTEEDESLDTAKMTIGYPGEEDHMVSDSFTLAINSVRGRAFQALIALIYLDGKGFSSKAEGEICTDVKKLYEKVLKKENTRALKFMFGYYLSPVFILNSAWVLKLLPVIFPQENEYLFTAAWEGYLSASLYEEIFFKPDIQELYKKGITLLDDSHRKQRPFKPIDKGIAHHLALAYIHYPDFDMNHTLMKAFWKQGTTRHHSYFIRYIGEYLLSDKGDRLTEIEDNGVNIIEKIRVLWDWLLQNYTNSQPFEEFGSWANLDKGAFEPAWLAEKLRKTVEKTNGALALGHPLGKVITQLARDAPVDTLEIMRLFLHKYIILGEGRRNPLFFASEWLEPFKILCVNMEVKSKTHSLISDLIRDGGSVFWDLKKYTEDDC